MNSSTKRVNEANYSDSYIRRDKDEDFFKALESSLDLNKSNEEKRKPFLFFIDGFAGIGKNKLLHQIKQEITQKCKQVKKPEPTFIWYSFDRIDTPYTPLKLMEDIEKKLSKNDQDHTEKHSEKSKKKSEFSKFLDQYYDTLNALALESIEGSGSGEQVRSVRTNELMSWKNQCR